MALVRDVLIYQGRDRTKFEVRDTGSGPQIVFWDTQALGAQPTPQDIAAVEASPGFVAWRAEHGGSALPTVRREAKDALDQQLSRIEQLIRAFALVVLDNANDARVRVVAEVQVAWNPASLADGAGVTQTVAAAGAAFGDYVLVAAPVSLQGITCTAYVHAADTVGIRLQNESGGTLDLANGTWQAAVYRTPAVRTATQLRNAIKAKLDAGDADA